MLLSANWPKGVGRSVLPEIDSTNAEAARRADRFAGPEWILALHQTKGRGRRGRAWHDPAGNFAASYLLRPDMAPAQAALYSFVASLALQDALVTATGRAESFALKWPNDVLLHGAKLAGILLETSGPYLVIGIGVNLVDHPEPEPGALRPVSLMGETGLRVTPEELLDLLAPAFAHWQAQFTAYGFAPIRTAWLARAARLGERIVARTVTDTHDGTFEGIDADGALLLRAAHGLRTIPAADVFF
ncbi:MAG: bifunctional biotin operon repressor / biotin-[acetyl-CoA-carboxylase] ligase BirA [Roseibaca calidilacus]|uniref:biotin--[biotin carboxyl-carrier protein] ligase n=1 Tax=Roseibaca calidilacus TaxID=1666912 RepID=A0A0P8ACP9_9RHOB|nr:biotin--[acetyl-CoA-carboxylase] ligase [Roseibaca calidilacus]KPP91971.1 MAG: bifunctional biotin operon repressor / biotin-[acetyl-CoA-carboxylase] ligase BirA [Roseibaca calidilacus]CUX82203.1 BirA family transcriptional regulator, biotin operon repressor / biotin-[acetyl-CoA-carboxylase] ligase [Roseibaca calidilacus]